MILPTLFWVKAEVKRMEKKIRPENVLDFPLEKLRKEAANYISHHVTKKQ